MYKLVICATVYVQVSYNSFSFLTEFVHFLEEQPLWKKNLSAAIRKVVL